MLLQVELVLEVVYKLIAEVTLQIAKILYWLIKKANANTMTTQ